MARGLPPDGCVDAVIGDVCTIAAQWLWVARLQVGFPEKPVAVTWEGSGGLYEDGPGLGMEMVEAMLFRVHNPFRPSPPIPTHQHTYTQNHTHSAWYSQRCLCSRKPVIYSLLCAQVSCSHPAHPHTIHGPSFHRTPPLGLGAMLLDIQMALWCPVWKAPISVGVQSCIQRVPACGARDTDGLSRGTASHKNFLLQTDCRMAKWVCG